MMLWNFISWAAVGTLFLKLVDQLRANIEIRDLIKELILSTNEGCLQWQQVESINSGRKNLYVSRGGNTPIILENKKEGSSLFVRGILTPSLICSGPILRFLEVAVQSQLQKREGNKKVVMGVAQLKRKVSRTTRIIKLG